MDKTKFKYASEFAVLMYLDKYQILQQTELEEYAKYQTTFNELTPCNIYFILRRPKVYLDPKYCVESKNSIELKYFINVQGRQSVNLKLK